MNYFENLLKSVGSLIKKFKKKFIYKWPRLSLYILKQMTEIDFVHIKIWLFDYSFIVILCVSIVPKNKNSVK